MLLPWCTCAGMWRWWADSIPYRRDAKHVHAHLACSRASHGRTPQHDVAGSGAPPAVLLSQLPRTAPPAHRIAAAARGKRGLTASWTSGRN
jgi:hypothetical protein